MIPFIDLEGGFLTTEELLFLAGASGGGGVEHTIINNPATFTTDMAKPLRKLLIPFTPVQSGTGDPSPTNIRPIAGWTGLNINRTGKNLFDKTVSPLVGYITSGNAIANFNVTRTVYCPCTPNTTYTVSKKQSSRFAVAYTKELPVIGSNVYGAITNNAATQISITTGADAMYIVVFCYHANYDTDTYQDIVDTLQVEIGSTATAYEPYSGTTVPVSWQTEAGTVYGGTLDALTGVLTVDRVAYTSDGTDYNDWSLTEQQNNINRFNIAKSKLPHNPKNSSTGNLLCNWLKSSTSTEAWNGFIGSTGNFLCYVPADVIADRTAWAAYTTEHPLMFVYELDEPYTIQLDPVTLSTLKGDNVIWTDINGDNTIVYLKKT